MKHPPSPPRRSPAFAVALAVALAVAALVGPGTVAHAQAPGSTPPSSAAVAPPTTAGQPAGQQATVAPGAASWSLTPSGDNPEEPGSRPDLSYDLAPGSRIDDSVTVWNSGAEPLNVRVYATDAFTTTTGGFDLLPGATRPTDVGSWVTVDTPAFTLPPNTHARLDIHIAVPADAAPGDHSGGVVASVTSPAKDDRGNAVVVDKRVGSRLYVRVAGPISPLLVVDQIDARYRGSANPFGSGELEVTYTVKNAGNVRLGARQRLRVAGVAGLGEQVRDPSELGEILPGAAVTRTETFTGVWPALLTSADLSVTPFSAKAKLPAEPAPFTRSASTWTMPWPLVALVLLIALVLRFAARRRQADGTSTAAGPGPVDGPDGLDDQAATPALPVP